MKKKLQKNLKKILKNRQSFSQNYYSHNNDNDDDGWWLWGCQIQINKKKKKFRRRFVDKIISECTYVYESGSTFV